MDQREMAEALVAALAQARGQVVNTDSDGLISAIPLSRLALENSPRAHRLHPGPKGVACPLIQLLNA